MVPVPRESYGKFFSGDSYIVLNTYQQPGSSSRRFDLHFWLGEKTSQDESGVAAYKSVELDDKLGGVPVQHREVYIYSTSCACAEYNPVIGSTPREWSFPFLLQGRNRVLGRRY